MTPAGHPETVWQPWEQEIKRRHFVTRMQWHQSQGVPEHRAQELAMWELFTEEAG
jgi:hypothetical protein